MYSDLQLTWNVTLDQPHEVRIANVGGIVRDRIEVAVDGEVVLHKHITFGSGFFVLTVEGRRLELHWEISSWTGKITHLILLERRILAAYGEIPEAFGPSPSHREALPAPPPEGAGGEVAPGERT